MDKLLKTRLVHLRCYSSAQAEAFYNEDHKAMQATLRKIIDNDINPHVDKWEAAEMYPAKEVFKKLADAGLLGEFCVLRLPCTGDQAEGAAIINSLS